MSMTTRSCKRRKPEVIQSAEESNTANSQNTGKQSSAEIPKESHQEQNNAEKQKEGQQQQNLIRKGEGTSLVDNHYLLPDDDGDGDQPMFEGSRISVKNFCNKLFSIADTYELPEKACNDVLRLVKRFDLYQIFNKINS
jgi:hypothetical protein